MDTTSSYSTLTQPQGSVQVSLLVEHVTCSLPDGIVD